MIEAITGILGIFNGLKAGLTGSWEILIKGKRIKVIRKLVILKITLEDIIDSAEDILISIEEILNHKKSSKEQIDSLKIKIQNQSRNLHLMLANLDDELSQKIFKTFKPELRKELERYINNKDLRMNFFSPRLYNLKASDIRKKYNENYLKEGYSLINELKTTSKSFTDFVTNHASIEDIL